MKGCWQQVSNELIGVTEAVPYIGPKCNNVAQAHRRPPEDTQRSAAGRQHRQPDKERTDKVGGWGRAEDV